jgi:hypothetical protein
VEARNVTTGVVLTTATNETGTYGFPSLLPGEYELRCQAGGFKSVRRAGVVLETGIARTANFQLELGAVSETVDVQASTPLLESESSTVGQFIERTTVANMPFQTRRIGSLARLAGAVAYTSENGKLATPQFAMAGGRSENQMWLTDGAVTQNMSLGSPQSVLNPPAESIQEIKMETNNYAAEFGRAGGGLILISTRSGSNAFHGAAYEFFRNDRLDSRSFFAPSKAPLPVQRVRRVRGRPRLPQSHVLLRELRRGSQADGRHHLRCGRAASTGSNRRFLRAPQLRAS